MSDCAACIGLGILFAIFAFSFGIKIAENVANQRWEKGMVERGLALYCPKTGEWAWAGECAE